MSRYLVAYLAVAVVLVALDMLWLRGIATNWYQQGIGHLMSPQVNMVAGALFYLLFPVGLVIFAVSPGLTDPWWRAAVFGALFGFFAYATYDLTNLAILKDWPLGLSVMDIAWGSVVSGVSAVAGRAAANAF
jgi:uncharacterized membrane protein